MIYTGFTDPSGNVIQIQGAGAVYDEEKNSLALGKETVANGQDQFVFGRVNEEDAAKVEVVGGGKMAPYNSGYKYHEWENENHFAFCAYKIGETKSEVEHYLSAVRNSKVTIQDWNENIKSVYRYQSNPGVMILVDVSSDDLKDGDNVYLIYVNSNTPSFSDTASPLAMYNLEKKAIGVSDYYYEVYQLYSAPEYLKGDVTMVRKAKNIRTLGWDGTQWNAGDITCDDGNGNTISMRDLFSRIAAMEAAQEESESTSES